MGHKPNETGPSSRERAMTSQPAEQAAGRVAARTPSTKPTCELAKPPSLEKLEQRVAEVPSAHLGREHRRPGRSSGIRSTFDNDAADLAGARRAALHFWAWLPIPLFLATIVVLKVAGSSDPHESVLLGIA